MLCCSGYREPDWLPCVLYLLFCPHLGAGCRTANQQRRTSNIRGTSCPVSFPFQFSLLSAAAWWRRLRLGSLQHLHGVSLDSFLVAAGIASQQSELLFAAPGVCWCSGPHGLDFRALHILASRRGFDAIEPGALDAIFYDDSKIQ